MMFTLASEEEIKSFLSEAKQFISEGKRDFIKRTYNHPSGEKIRWMQALLDIGLTNVEQVWNETLGLTPRDYMDGPVTDNDRPGDGKVIWIFKKNINGVRTYIKIKIDHRGCVCLSFHKDWQ